jgi:hypothetical protein
VSQPHINGPKILCGGKLSAPDALHDGSGRSSHQDLFLTPSFSLLFPLSDIILILEIFVDLKFQVMERERERETEREKEGKMRREAEGQHQWDIP